MTSFLVKSATKKKDIPDGKYGPAKVLSLVLQEYGQSNEIAAEWYTKAETPEPQAGSRLEGTVEPSDHGPKFKKASGGGGFSRSGGRSPEQEKSITRMHSQHMALLYLQAKATAGKLEANPKPSELVPLIDFFDRDALNGWKEKPSLPPAAQRSDLDNTFPVSSSGGPDALGGPE